VSSSYRFNMVFLVHVVLQLCVIDNIVYMLLCLSHMHWCIMYAWCLMLTHVLCYTHLWCWHYLDWLVLWGVQMFLHHWCAVLTRIVIIWLCGIGACIYIPCHCSADAYSYTIWWRGFGLCSWTAFVLSCHIFLKYCFVMVARILSCRTCTVLHYNHVVLVPHSTTRWTWWMSNYSVASVSKWRFTKAGYRGAVLYHYYNASF